jgi:hypothetical protein
MIPLLLLLLALPTPSVHAATGAVSSVDEFAGELQAYSEKLAALPQPSAECRGPYSKVDAQGPLSIGVFFGFIDTGRKNYVADGDFKQALIRLLTKGCRRQLRACGFAVSAGDPAAPNMTRLLGSQDGRNVEIDVYDSSVSSDYSAAATRLSARQEAESSLIEEQYLAALGRDAVVLYAGHTRRFSDTGFYPPLAFSKTTAATLLRRPFYSRVYDALKQSSSPPAILGLFACYTQEYFAGRIHAYAPGTALIVGSGSSPHENNLMALLGAINLVLSRPCYDEALRSINPGDAPAFGIYGLFDQSPHLHYTRYRDGRLVAIALLIIPFLVLLASRWAPSAAESWPAGALSRTRRGAAFMMLLVVPCTVVARAFADQSTALPLLLALLGLLSLAIAVGKSTISRGQLTAAARQACPSLLAFLFLYFCLNLIGEASPDSALSALRQATTFTLAFFLLWPFVLFSEEALFASFAGDDSPAFIPACIRTLAFYFVLWLSLCALAPAYKPKLWPIAAFVVYIRTSSFLLYRRKPRRLASAISVAMTLALLITEGVHALIYN